MLGGGSAAGSGGSARGVGGCGRGQTARDGEGPAVGLHIGWKVGQQRGVCRSGRLPPQGRRVLSAIPPPPTAALSAGSAADQATKGPAHRQQGVVSGLGRLHGSRTADHTAEQCPWSKRRGHRGPRWLAECLSCPPAGSDAEELRLAQSPHAGEASSPKHSHGAREALAGGLQHATNLGV